MKPKESTTELCPKCKELHEISRLRFRSGKWGKWLECEDSECDYKKQIWKKKSYDQRMRERFPVDEEKRRATLKARRESKKNVSFKGFSKTL